MELSRRKLFTGIAALIAAPTIVRVASIMPVRSQIIVPDDEAIFFYTEYDADAFDYGTIVRETLRQMPERLADNVTRHNALIARLTGAA